MPQQKPAVAILPNHIKLGWTPGVLSLDDMIWPLGQPDRLKGGALRDLTPEDHLLVFPRGMIHWRLGFGTRAKVSVMILEPQAIHGKHARRLRLSYRRFFRVLSFYEDLCATLPNALFFPFGSTWVPDWREIEVEKVEMCSLIASAKRSLEGHALRHEIADWANSQGIALDVMGGGYRPFKDKADGLAPYRYSVVIENVRERHYFTEKLVDAILCKTVPIYWGCPNIGDYFDTSGMVICDSAEDVRAALCAMSEDDYAARLPALEAARGQADDYGDVYGRAARAVLEAAGQMP
ncbi:hypothetical protein [Roseovarius sp. MMSF_3281]|uniref:hypothetical protein n=1 Tax=Roseovarius sp. MMSF_3281 TaxID=3046694 RepID=UPI00273F2B9F|nr:hypothetical protein [Roseovarius sp. MMSF_3281]